MTMWGAVSGGAEADAYATPMDTRRRRCLVAIAVIAILADAVTKLAAVRWLTGSMALPGLTLRVTRNPGAAFSLGADQPPVLVLAVTGLAVAGMAVAAWRGHLGGPASGGLLLGGGVANFGDRAIGGSVVDLFDLGWWPVFNLADVFISTGIFLLMLLVVRRGRSVGADEVTTG